MSEQIETFKKKLHESRSQLSQALELNEKLINEVNMKDQTISQFKQAKHSLNQKLEEKDAKIQELQNQITQFKNQKFNNRLNTLADKWIQKNNLSPDKKPEVLEMLSTFKDEQGDLSKVESFLGLSKEEKVSPKPLTKSSNVVAEKFSKQGIDYNNLSREDKMKILHQKLESIHNK